MHQEGSTLHWRRACLAGLVLSLLAVPAALRSPRADALVAAPPASGWYVTGYRAAAGIELLSIRRDQPLARGQVAVIPRSALYRVRTVLASDQLVGGTGRDLTTNLCARVHCHVATNGDRWDLFGHDAGRLTGAVAVEGELIATQPRPPADPYAHLLIGRDGSMRGTTDFQIPLAPAVRAGELEIPVDVNRQPTTNGTSAITRRYNTESRTPPGTVEYIFRSLGSSPSETVIEPLERRAGSGPIPDGGVVVAANGAEAIARAEEFWSEAVSGQRTTLQNGLNGHREIIGGSPLLLIDGFYGYPHGDSDGRNPRTAIGWDQTKVWMVTVDGRRPGWSEGLTYLETAQMLRWLGATDALNLDGGGSSAFVGFGKLRNWPSGDTQRAVASALVVMPPENRVGPPPPPLDIEPACPRDRVPPSGFVDTFGNVHRAAIDCAAWWTLTSGSSPSTYDPAEWVRRDQMATFLARYLARSGVALPGDPPDAFPDDEASVHEPSIDALAAIGVVTGRSDGRFVPAQSVSRGQMATFLARAISKVVGTELPHTTDYFADDSGDVHEPSVNMVTEARIAGGTADGQYRSTSAVTRDQMAAFLARSLTASVITGRATPPG